MGFLLLRLYLPKSKSQKFLANIGEKVLASFPVQATIHFYNDDTESEEEEVSPERPKIHIKKWTILKKNYQEWMDKHLTKQKYSRAQKNPIYNSFSKNDSTEKWEEILLCLLRLPIKPWNWKDWNQVGFSSRDKEHCTESLF